MELKDFIFLTMTQIFQGVSEAQNNITDEFAKINPPIVIPPESKHPLYFGQCVPKSGFDAPSFLIEFDIAVDVEESTSSKAGGGIFIAPFGFGSQSGDSSINKQFNRIKFVIPYTLPVNKKD